MSTPDNDSRADLAQETLRYFCKEAPGRSHNRVDDDITESDISDLICNLMHLCKRDGIEWDWVMHSAESNFEAESEEESNE